MGDRYHSCTRPKQPLVVVGRDHIRFNSFYSSHFVLKTADFHHLHWTTVFLRFLQDVVVLAANECLPPDVHQRCCVLISMIEDVPRPTTGSPHSSLSSLTCWSMFLDDSNRWLEDSPRHLQHHFYRPQHPHAKCQWWWWPGKVVSNLVRIIAWSCPTMIEKLNSLHVVVSWPKFVKWKIVTFITSILTSRLNDNRPLMLSWRNWARHAEIIVGTRR